MYKFTQRAKKIIAPATTALIFFAGSGHALANCLNSWNLGATTIPASACQPVDSTDAGVVKLSNGAWVFDVNAPASASFYCPLHLNEVQLNDPFGPNTYLDQYRVLYRDPDGGFLGCPGGVCPPPAGQQAIIQVELTYRDVNGMQKVPGSKWTSMVSSFVNTANTHATKKVGESFVPGAIYAFEVTMTRANPALKPAFSGIDFCPLSIQ